MDLAYEKKLIFNNGTMVSKLSLKNFKILLKACKCYDGEKQSRILLDSQKSDDELYGAE